MSDTAEATRPETLEEGAKAPSLSRLIKLMGMTTSLNDNEALAFLRRANEEAAKFGTWAEILSGKITVIGDPFANLTIPRATAAPAAKPRAPSPPPPPPPPPKPARDLSSVLHFGKHAGRTVREIIDLGDTSYIRWALREVDGFTLTLDAATYLHTAENRRPPQSTIPSFGLHDFLYTGPYQGGSVYEIIHRDCHWVCDAIRNGTFTLTPSAQLELDRAIRMARAAPIYTPKPAKPAPRKSSKTKPRISDL